MELKATIIIKADTEEEIESIINEIEYRYSMGDQVVRVDKNSHEALLEACKLFKKFTDTLPGGFEFPVMIAIDLKKAMDKNKTAIAAAGGE